jgi:hypothetical protein
MSRTQNSHPVGGAGQDGSGFQPSEGRQSGLGGVGQFGGELYFQPSVFIKYPCAVVACA